MATCIKCGQDAGFFKVQCSDCFNAAQEDDNPAPMDAQQDDDRLRPQAEDSPEVPYEPDDDPQVTQGSTSFAGRFLRFAGMIIIVAVILFAVVFWQEPVAFFGLLVIGLVGAAMHYKGRKLAPGKPGASILGGILGGVAGSAALIIGALFMIAIMLDACKAFFGF
jgi:hypothetical protein